jgi:hypothetical protein
LILNHFSEFPKLSGLPKSRKKLRPWQNRIHVCVPFAWIDVSTSIWSQRFDGPNVHVFK